MEKIWMKNWPDFIPKEVIYPKGEKPLFEYLRDNAREFPERTAIIFYGREVTYRELDEKSEKFAHFLLDSGFKKGDRIALFLPSCPQYHIAHYGINKMGGIIIPCSPVFKEWELAYELKDSGARAIVSLDLLYPVAAGAGKECDLQKIIVTSLHDFLPEKETMNLVPMMKIPKAVHPGTVEFLDIMTRYPADPVQADVSLEDIVQFQYTGGTTGLPKGAILTHRAKLFKVANVTNIMKADLEFAGYTGDAPVCLSTLPTFHIAGMLASVDAQIALGSTQILMVMFDPVAAMQAIDHYKIDYFQATVPMTVGIMDHPERKNYDLSTLKLCLATSFGIQLTEEIATRWKEDTNGCILVEAAYGLSETHTFDSYMPLNKPKYEQGCQGIPLPGADFKIVSFEDRTREVPVGEMGEISLTHPAVFKGYWNKPVETKDTLIDGWVYTGDMGKFDEDGYLYFLGRKKEMIKTSGFSVFPEEVELFLCRHEAVDRAAVIGVPDEKKGEVIKAFVIPKPQFKDTISPDAIISWAKEMISPYKVPKNIEIRSDFPMSGAGKVLRRELLEEELKKK
ncbi:MAG: AMP-binding protein [Syntrophales bacterium]|jgi:long-chain acyl-CoA synthetase|nr:AMP-binding protein [Syntrophales bacterium]MDY0044299.1 AMP-binding protein [Syntrophales bacterium]